MLVILNDVLSNLGLPFFVKNAYNSLPLEDIFHIFKILLNFNFLRIIYVYVKVKEESEKVGLKLNIPKTKIMTSGPITSWQIDGENSGNSDRLYFWGAPKITADGDCSHEIKRCLLFGRKAKTNLDSILKSRHITLPTKVHLAKATVLTVVMYGCESWTIKKAEC